MFTVEEGTAHDLNMLLFALLAGSLFSFLTDFCQRRAACDARHMRLALDALQRSSGAALFTYGCAARAFQQFCTA